MSDLHNPHILDDLMINMWFLCRPEELQHYYGIYDFLVCPDCELMVADVDEMKNDHLWAGKFKNMSKEDLYHKRK